MNLCAILVVKGASNTAARLWKKKDIMDKKSAQRKAFMTKDRVIRGITEDGFLKVAVVKTTDVVKEAQRRHGLSLLSTVMLGRALTGVMLLASDLKGEERVLLRIEGDGPLGIITAEANRAGEIRGFVQHPSAMININAGEKLEDGVGRGLLSVSKTLFSEAKPITGTVELTQGDIHSDITQYLYQSEQVPSALLLDVGITPEGEVEGAGGIIIQALPGAPIEHIEKVGENIQAIHSISEQFREGDYIDTLMEKALEGIPYKELIRYPVHFFCRCSHKRFLHSLAMLPLADLEEMQHEPQELVCHNCSEVYTIAPEEIQNLLEERQKQQTLN